MKAQISPVDFGQKYSPNIIVLSPSRLSSRFSSSLPVFSFFLCRPYVAGASFPSTLFRLRILFGSFIDYPCGFIICSLTAQWGFLHGWFTFIIIDYCFLKSRLIYVCRSSIRNTLLRLIPPIHIRTIRLRRRSVKDAVPAPANRE